MPVNPNPTQGTCRSNFAKTNSALPLCVPEHSGADVANHRGFVHSVLCILCLAFAFSLPESYESGVTHVIMVQEPFMCKGI